MSNTADAVSEMSTDLTRLDPSIVGSVIVYTNGIGKKWTDTIHVRSAYIPNEQSETPAQERNETLQSFLTSVQALVKYMDQNAFATSASKTDHGKQDVYEDIRRNLEANESIAKNLKIHVKLTGDADEFRSWGGSIPQITDE